MLNLFNDTLRLCSKLWHTRSICDNLFDLQRSSKLPKTRWHYSHNNRKWLKQSQSHFHYEILHNKQSFSLFSCFPCASIPDISSLSKNINNVPCVSRLSFRFLWLWLLLKLKLERLLPCYFKEKVLGSGFWQLPLQLFMKFGPIYSATLDLREGKI